MIGLNAPAASWFRRLTSIGLLGALLLVAAPSIAQESDSANGESESNRHDEEAERAQKAKEVFDRGMEHYVEEDYTKAIVDFKRAHDLYPSATLLYNIAMARMNQGKSEKAAKVAREALEFDGEPLPDDSRAQARAVVDGSGLVASARTLADASASDDSTGTAAAPPPKTDESTGSDGTLGPLGWSGIGMSAVGVAGLVGIPIVANNYDQQVERLERLSTGPSRPAFREQQNKVESTRQNGRLLSVAAPAVTAVGAGLLAVDLLVLQKSDERVSAGLGPTGRLQIGLQW
jgi:tetratricopeptide (TPR) repeat protein